MPPNDPDFGANLNLPEGGVPVDSLSRLGPYMQRKGLNNFRGPITPDVIEQIGGDLSKAVREDITTIRQMQQSGEAHRFTNEISEMKGVVEELKGFLGNPAFQQHFLPEGQLPQGEGARTYLGLRALANQRFPGESREGGAISQESLTRSEARIARSILREGGSLTPQMRQRFTQQEGALGQEVQKLRTEFEKNRDVNPEEARRISTEVASKSNLAQELRNILEADSKETKHGVDKALSFMTQIASTMAVGSMVTSRMITDPYRYQFQPAMTALGRQGALGQTLAGAYGTEKSYDVQNNTQAAYAGMGIAGMGLNLMMGGNVAAGGLTMAAGGVLGTLGLTGKFNDILQSVGIKLSHDTIVGNQIAQQIADPNALINPFMQSRAGLFQMGGANQSNFGYYMNGQVTQGNRRLGTGNAILDRIAGRGTMLNALGYSGAQAGQLLSTVSQNVVGNPDQLANYTNFVGQAAKGFGINESQVVGMLSSATRAGSTNATRSTRMAMESVSNNGNLTNYQMNVLVPALMKVTESMSIRNVARSSEDLQQEIYSLRNSMQGSQTPLGNLVRTNPQAFNQVYTSINQAVKSALDNPARMAQDIMLGSSVGDIIQGKAGVFTNRLDRLMVNNPVFRNINTTQEMYNNPQALGALLQMGSLVGINDPQMLTQLFLMRKQGNLSTQDFTKAAQQRINAGQETAVEKRAKAIVDSDFGKLMKSMADQANAMQTATQSVEKSIQDIQDKIKQFEATGAILDYAKKGIDKIVSEVEKLLGNKKSPAQRTADATRVLPQRVQSANPGTDTSQMSAANAETVMTQPGWLAARGKIMQEFGARNVASHERGLAAYLSDQYTKAGGHIGGQYGDFSSWAKQYFQGLQSGEITNPRYTMATPPYRYTQQPGQQQNKKGVDIAGITNTGNGNYTVTMNVTGVGKDDFTKVIHSEIAKYVDKNHL